MSKTQINAWMPTPAGREQETLQQMAQILREDDIDFGISAVAETESAGMELVFLSEQLKDTPIMLMKISLFDIKKFGSTMRIQEMLAKFAYQFRKEPLKSLISYPNKQYFIPHHAEGEVVDVNFLNAGTHTTEECENITKEIKDCMDAILENPAAFHNSLYEELNAEDEDLGLEMKQTDETYRLLHKNEPVTEWSKFDGSVDWDEFIKDLHKEYKLNTNANV